MLFGCLGVLVGGAGVLVANWRTGFGAVVEALSAGTDGFGGWDDGGFGGLRTVGLGVVVDRGGAGAVVRCGGGGGPVAVGGGV